MKGLNKSATESYLLTAAGLFEHVWSFSGHQGLKGSQPAIICSKLTIVTL